MFMGENKIIQFTAIGNDLIANVQYEIETINGERLTGFLYCTHQPKNYYLKINNMKTQFKLGQIVRFKNYRRNNDEKEAYFVVIQEEDVANEMVLYTINTNRNYISGTTIIPEFPEEDLLIVDLKPSDLINQEITIKENLFHDVVIGVAVYFLGDNDSIQFNHVGDLLVSNVEFEFNSTIKHRLKGNLYIDLLIPLQ
jgi:hypothetical protein